jgi:hypothetical protein
MKKITLLIASIFLVGSVASASELINFPKETKFPVNTRNAEPIVFIQRGIEFYIFPDGQFDFNTVPSTNTDFYYKNGRRNGNRTFGTPRSYSNAGIRIEHDNFGRIRRVGNVFMNYDADNRIKRIGTVYMAYNRFSLVQVGGLRIIYNRRGQIVNFIGNVNGRMYDDVGYNNNDFDDNYYNDYSNNNNNNNEDDFYYYRTDGTKAKAVDPKIKE